MKRRKMMAKQGIIYSSEKCLAYRASGHPERPERVGETLKHLKKQRYEIQKPFPVCKDDLLIAHSEKQIESVKNGNFYDPDTPYFPNIYEIAILSCGGALQAMESAIQGTPAFSLTRPPGHHAGPRSGISGFCYFNNIAIAVLKALNLSPSPPPPASPAPSRCAVRSGTSGSSTGGKGLAGVERVAILDIDVHHGNGTQDIVLGNEKILFCSLHQVPLYPGTGMSSEKNCLNFPLPPGTGEKTYLKTLDSAIGKIEEFKPDLIAVSAGFDTYKDCPLANFTLTIESYKKIGERISSLNLPRFATLEGGYSDDLPFCIESFLQGFF